MATIQGTSGNDYVHPNDGTVQPGYNDLPAATDGGDTFLGGLGGDDLVRLAGGDDRFQFDADLTAADLLDGGSGNDELVIGGPVSTIFGAGSLTSIERITLGNFPVLVGVLASDNLTFANENIAAGADMTVDGSALTDQIAMFVDFSAEADANRVTVIGGGAGDTIRGRGTSGFNDYIDLSQGGADDVASAGSMYFGSTYDANDRVDGLFNGRIRLDGDYSGGLTLTAGMATNLSGFAFGPEGAGGAPTHDYYIVIAADAVAPGDGGYSFDASGQKAGSSVTVDATADTGHNFDIIGSPGNETLLGNGGLNIFQLFGAGTDRFSGGAGNDWVTVNNNNGQIGGDDTLEGGTGQDTLYMSGFASDPILYDGLKLSGFERIVANSDQSMMTLILADGALPAARKLVIDWSAVANPLYELNVDATAETDGRLDVTGGAAADALLGGGGADSLSGGGGNDTLTGNAGDDTLFGGDGADRLRGGGGVNELRGGAGNDVYLAPVLEGADRDIIREAANGGTDRVETNRTFSLATIANVERLTLTGISNADGTGNALDNLIVGNAGANTLSGQQGDDTLEGGDGADRLVGGPGADLLRGGAQDDLYVNPVLSGPGADTIEEGINAGTDTVQSAETISIASAGNVENVVLAGGANADATGNDLANALFGNAARNTLLGGLGNDTLSGGAGKDVLIGGKGADILIGGDDADTFRFAASSTGSDVINGFEVSQDRFDLSGGTFSAAVEIAGSTRLSHSGGTITVAGATGLALSEWNALVLPAGGTASVESQGRNPDLHADAAASGPLSSLHELLLMLWSDYLAV